MKNSDIKNFEKHLNNYLSFIRKNNKDVHYFNLNKDYSDNPVYNNEQEDSFDQKKTNENAKSLVKSISLFKLIY